MLSVRSQPYHTGHAWLYSPTVLAGYVPSDSIHRCRAVRLVMHIKQLCFCCHYDGIVVSLADAKYAGDACKVTEPENTKKILKRTC